MTFHGACYGALTMDAPGYVPDSINCHSCGAVIDLAGQTGFTHIECARCEALSVVPLKFGDFLLLNPLGIGGMGTVYKAIDLSLNRYLAVKILRKKVASNPEFIEHFTREARSAATVNHTNIAQVYSFGEHEGQYYMAMELLERGSLDDRIVKLGKLPEKDVIDIGLKIASGLKAALQKGLLHLDIKPGNILFNGDNAPKIVDFGLARVQESTVKPAGQQDTALPRPIWGTPYYIAPEKLRGQQEDFRSDVYSLGASLFHALAGRPPFEAETAGEVVSKHAKQPAYSLKTYTPTVNDFTAHIIARMLAKEPVERYGSYDELLHDFKEAQRILKAAESTTAVVASTGEKFSIGSILSTVAVIVTCGLAIWFVWTNRVTIFQLGSPAVSQQAQDATSAAPGHVATAPSDGGIDGEFDFSNERPWMADWKAATLQLAQGRFTDALFGYDVALIKAGGQHRAVQWIIFYEAVTLIAADRADEVPRLLARIARPGTTTSPLIPDNITVGNFAGVLHNVLNGRLPLSELESALPRLPDWAAAMTCLTAALVRIQTGEFHRAAESLRCYHLAERDEEHRWAYNLQPLAEKLARQCDSAASVLARIDSMQREGNYSKALQAINEASAVATMGGLKIALARREQELSQQAEEHRQQLDEARREAEQAQVERDQRERQLASQEERAIREVDAKVSPFLQNYEFRRALAEYNSIAGNLETPAGRRMLDQRRSSTSQLGYFLSQLAQDISRLPYERRDLIYRTGLPLRGKLARADESRLFLEVDYGEIQTNWRELPPAELVKLAGFYAIEAAQTEPSDALAKRHRAVAYFCRQYGLNQAAHEHAQRALRYEPALREEVESFFSKSSR